MKTKKAAPRKEKVNVAELHMNATEFDRMMGKALGTAPPKPTPKPRRRRR